MPYKILNVGGGNQPPKLETGHHLPGTLQTDIRFECKPNVVCDGVFLPFKNGVFEEVHSYHFLEHLTSVEGYKAMCEMHRVLKPGGRVVIEMPDFFKCCEMIANRIPHPHVMGFMFGAQRGDRGRDDVHGWGYTHEDLEIKLCRAGFKDVKHLKAIDYHARNGPCMRAEAIK